MNLSAVAKTITLDWIMARVFVSPNGCWLWIGADSGDGRGGGYGKMKRSGVWYYVHRVIYLWFYGRLPAHYQVDHLCARWFHVNDPVVARRCCNPEHLEAVPGVINQRRKYAA